MSDGKVMGQRTLVTGASSGIGAAHARSLARRGADLVLVARRRERLESLAEELRSFDVEVQVEPLDLSDPAAADRLFAETEGQGRPVDILVNNAGIGHYGRLVDVAWPVVERQIRVNLVALTRLTHLFVPKMIERGRGHSITEIVMMSSERCAEIAVEKMLAGRRNVITGWYNALGRWLLRLLPRATYPALAELTMSQAVDEGGGE